MLNLLNLKIRSKLLISFSVLILIIVLCGYIGYSSSHSIDQKLETTTDVLMPKMQLLIEADRDLQQLLVAERSMIFANAATDVFKTLVSDYETNLKQAETRFGKYAELADTPEEAKLIEEYYKLHKEWQEVSKQIVDGRKEDTRQGRALALDLSLGEAMTKFEAMRDKIDQLTNITSEQAATLKKQADTTKKRSIYTLTSFILFSLILSIIILIVLTKAITGGILRVNLLLREISEGEGDLTKTLPVLSKDEVGEMSQYFNMFVSKLRDIINIVKQSSSSVAAGSSELASTAEHLSESFSEQSGQIVSVASATEEISTSSEGVMRSLEDVREKTETASEHTKTGKKQLLSAVSEIVGIKNNMDNLAKTLTGLSESSQQIGNILNVINDIADQTNLLALNAAIEAARAGEHGRGFAVVADEVRKLAERSQDAIKEIESIILNLRNETTSANADMQSSLKRVDSGVNVMRETEQSFELIVSSVTMIEESSSIITSAIHEQTTAIHNINENAQVISNNIEKSNASLSEVASTVADLEHQADDLKVMVDKFKT